MGRDACFFEKPSLLLHPACRAHFLPPSVLEKRQHDLSKWSRLPACTQHSSRWRAAAVCAPMAPTPIEGSQVVRCRFVERRQDAAALLRLPARHQALRPLADFDHQSPAWLCLAISGPRELGHDGTSSWLKGCTSRRRDERLCVAFQLAQGVGASGLGGYRCGSSKYMATARPYRLHPVLPIYVSVIYFLLPSALRLHGSYCVQGFEPCHSSCGVLGCDFGYICSASVCRPSSMSRSRRSGSWVPR